MDYDLRHLRTRTGVSQAQLARLAGVSRSTISAYESGHRTPSSAIAERILGELQRPSVTLHGHRTAVVALAREYGFHDVRVFCSCARGEDEPGSDVDLPVYGEHVNPFDISGFVQDACDLLNGIKVDVVVSGGTGPSMDRITAEAIRL